MSTARAISTMNEDLATAQINVALCDNAETWDRFVFGEDAASSYHMWRWREVIAKTYGHKPFYLAAAVGQEIVGVLPMFLVRSRIFGTALVSMPFSTYGGVLAQSKSVRDQLLIAAEELGKELKVARIDLRQGDEIECAWACDSAKVLMTVPLPDSADAAFRALSSRLRGKIRQTTAKHGLVARWENESGLRAFYQVFARNMHFLGTPVYPQRWFENIQRAIPEDTRILTVWDGAQPVASTFVHTLKELVELPWIASTPESRKKYSTVLLYWTVMEWAIENGYRTVDLGRCTRGGGTYEFKTQWNCEERPLRWYSWSPKGSAARPLRPDNPKYAMAIAAWKKLPLGVANWLGPKIVRSIP